MLDTPTTTAVLKLEGLMRSFKQGESEIAVLNGASAAIYPGESVALVGPSGAGKTSALRVVAGLARPARGRVELGGETWLDTERGIDLRPEERRVGLVFQEYALFPHMSVRANVAYGGRERVDELLERFHICLLYTSDAADE